MAHRHRNLADAGQCAGVHFGHRSSTTERKLNEKERTVLQRIRRAGRTATPIGRRAKPVATKSEMLPDMLSDLQRMNPWWEGKPLPPTPPTRRHLVEQIHRRLEAALAPIIVVRGPRQIGKSTSQVQVIEDLLGRVSGYARSIDAPAIQHCRSALEKA